MASEKQDPKSLDGNLYMDAAQAAALLDISLRTLYTYVSRKNIRSQKVAGSRESRYLRSDIELLKRGTSSGSDRQSAPGLTSATGLTLVTESDVYYRGQKATTLAETASLEDVARLLWSVDGRDPFKEASLIPDGSNWNAVVAASEGVDTLDRITMLLPIMEAANARAHDTEKNGFLRSGADALLRSAALEIGRTQRSASPIHRYIASITSCGPRIEDLVRRVLVLSADIGLDTSSYTVRAAANAGATPYRCVAAGLATSGGKRLSAARTISFARFIAEIEAATDYAEPIRTRVKENEALPGFGFSPFAATDSRAVHLMAAMKQQLQRDRRFARFDSALSLAQELTGFHPDFALLATYVAQRVGAPGKPNLVRTGRLVGWIAHALEQQQDSSLIRWKVGYKGPLPDK